MSEDTPRSIDEVDRNLAGAIRAYHRLRWYALGVLATILTMAMAGGGLIIYHQQHQLRAGCSFFTDLAKLPVTPAPPVKQPSRLGVSIVADSRIAAFGLGCTNIPPPSASLVKWAAYYHIPLR